MTHNVAPRIIMRDLKIDCLEMLFYLELPVKLANSSILRVPKRLECFEHMIYLAICDFEGLDDDVHAYNIYLTAKSLYVTPNYIGGREGWHIDGFGTNNKTYIWSDKLETEFCIKDFNLSDDCDQSMRDMDAQAHDDFIFTFGEGSLLALDTRHVHRCPKADSVMRRTFAKVTFSKDRFDMKGNSHNHLLDYDWVMFERGNERNHTTHTPKTERE